MAEDRVQRGNVEYGEQSVVSEREFFDRNTPDSVGTLKYEFTGENGLCCRLTLFDDGRANFSYEWGALDVDDSVSLKRGNDLADSYGWRYATDQLDDDDRGLLEDLAYEIFENEILR